MNSHLSSVDSPSPRPRNIRGSDEFAAIGGEVFLHWDLWFAIVLIERFDGNVEAMRAALLELTECLAYVWQRESGIEPRLSLLTDLRDRMQRADTTAAELISRTEITAYLSNKARGKVLGDKHGVSEPTDAAPAMVNTPRARLQRRARRGNWAQFPVSPEPYYETFLHGARSRNGYSKHASFKVAGRLEERLARAATKAARAGLAEQLACYRGFLAAFHDALDRTDDSYGNMGQLCIDTALPGYLKLDWQSSGIEPATYYRDFVEYAVWDEYGMVDSGRRDQSSAVDRFCRKVPVAEFVLVDEIICSLIDELSSEFNLESQIAEAQQLRATLIVTKRRFDLFAEVAAQLGSDHWMAIERMAQVALDRDRADIAADVFRTADVPGRHRDRLNEMRQQML